MNYFQHYQDNAKKIKDTYLVVDRYDSETEKNIFPDILQKVPNLCKDNIEVLDIGCGCSALAKDIVNYTQSNNQNLTLIDGKDMLDRIKCPESVKKISGCFPKDFAQNLKDKKFDVIITYSVIHYALMDGLLFDFLDSAVGLLADGGEFLIGDIPNFSKKKRFLNSDFGYKFNLEYIKSHPNTKMPEIKFSIFEKGIIDDSLMFYILQRYRNMGYDTYIMPQKEGLPFNYTREDILIRKP